MSFCCPKLPCPRGAIFPGEYFEAAISSFLRPLRAVLVFSSLSPREDFQGRWKSAGSSLPCFHTQCEVWTRTRCHGQFGAPVVLTDPQPDPDSCPPGRKKQHRPHTLLCKVDRLAPGKQSWALLGGGDPGVRKQSPPQPPCLLRSGGWRAPTAPPHPPAGMAWELSLEQARMVTEQPLLHETWER